MPEFLAVATLLVLLATALGLIRLLRGPGDAERMMAAQLFGTGGVAALLLGATIVDPVDCRCRVDAGAAGGLRFGRLRQVWRWPRQVIDAGVG